MRVPVSLSRSMQTVRSIGRRRVLLILMAGALAAFLLVHECASGGNMGAMDRTCRCIGIEWTLDDRRPADGPRRTSCLGIVASRTCHRISGGPVIECPR